MSRKFLCGVAVFLALLGAEGLVSLAATPAWVNATANLANMASECGNLTMLSSVPNSDTVIAGVALKGLWASTSAGTWVHLGAGTGSDTIINRPSWIAYDPAHPGTFWESGIYSGGGVFKTTDGGNTFRQLGSISHDDYVSVDFGDANRQTLLAGGHEQSRTVYRSTNGGLDWTNIGLNLPANTNFSSAPFVVSSQTYLVNTAGWGGGTSGIYRTTNGGTSWQQVSTQGPVGPPLVASDGAIYWSFGNSLLKSTSSGSTWTEVGSNLRTVTPVELPDKRLVSVAGSTLVISADGGVTWSPLGPDLPYVPAGVIYSPQRKAFFIWQWDCGNVVLPNAIMKLDWEFSIATPPGAPQNFKIVG